MKLVENNLFVTCVTFQPSGEFLFKTFKALDQLQSYSEIQNISRTVLNQNINSNMSKRCRREKLYEAEFEFSILWALFQI